MLKSRIILLGLVILMVGIAAGAGILTQTFTPPTTTAPIVTSSCTVLAPTPASGIVVGSAGTVLFECGSAPAGPAAFTAIAGSATPSFSLASTGYTGLSFLAHSTSATTCSGGTALITGAAVSFTAGAYDYCASYGPAPSTFGSFTVTWNQP